MKNLEKLKTKRSELNQKALARIDKEDPKIPQLPKDEENINQDEPDDWSLGSEEEFKNQDEPDDWSLEDKEEIKNPERTLEEDEAENVRKAGEELLRPV